MFNELFPDQQQAYYHDIAQRGVSAPLPQQSAWSGFGRTVGSGLMEGGAMAARGIGMLGAVVAKRFDQEEAQWHGRPQNELTDQYFRALDETTKPAVDFWKVDPATVGKASQVAGGFSRALLPLAAGGFNPSLLVASEQTGAFDELTAQGVDGSTANKVAAVRGVTTAAGAMLPAALVPGRLAAAGAGAVVNTGLGMTDRAATSAILEHADYGKIADQYKVLDGTQLAVDALLGALFGGVAGKSRARPSPDEHAAALVLNDAHAMQDASLARPADPNAQTAETRVQARAAAQLNNGEMVSVDAAHTDPVRVDELRQQTQARLQEQLHTEFAQQHGGEVTMQRLAGRNETANLSPEEIAFYKQAGIDTGVSTPAIDVPTWKTEKINIDSPRDVTDAHDVFYRPEDNARAIHYDIKDAGGNVVGETVLEIKDGRPVRLLDIAINNDAKGKRYGENAVSTILSRTESGQLGVWNIIDSARSWWDRIGTQPAGSTDGILSIADHANARTGRENAGGMAQGGRGAQEPQAVVTPPKTEPAGQAVVSHELTAQQDPIAALVAREPDRIIRDEHGNDVRATDLLAQADGDIRQAETDQHAYRAAALCFLTHGGA